MSTEMFQGAVAPEVYRLDVKPGTSAVDLSTVSVASLKVRRPDGTTTSWSVAMSLQTATTLRLEHTFASGETDQLGNYGVYAELTIPSGTVRTVPQQLLVKDKYRA